MTAIETFLTVPLGVGLLVFALLGPAAAVCLRARAKQRQGLNATIAQIIREGDLHDVFEEET